MSYVLPNFKSKAALKKAVANGEVVRVKLMRPPSMPEDGTILQDGTESIEGPHYPAPHSWYGTATVKDGVVVKVK